MGSVAGHYTTSSKCELWPLRVLSNEMAPQYSVAEDVLQCSQTITTFQVGDKSVNKTR